LPQKKKQANGRESIFATAKNSQHPRRKPAGSLKRRAGMAQQRSRGTARRSDPAGGTPRPQARRGGSAPQGTLWRRCGAGCFCCGKLLHGTSLSLLWNFSLSTRCIIIPTRH